MRWPMTSHWSRKRAAYTQVTLGMFNNPYPRWCVWLCAFCNALGSVYTSSTPLRRLFSRWLRRSGQTVDLQGLLASLVHRRCVQTAQAGNRLVD
jgi:hypothetical protein